MRRLILSALLVVSTAHAHHALDVSEAWIRAAPPGVEMLAAYMILNNPSDHDVVITEIRSDRFGSIQAHRTEIQDGVARMRSLDELSIAAGGTLRLSPGGIHLMLMRPVGSIRSGDEIDLTLCFSDGESQTVRAIVMRDAPSGDAP